MSKQKFSIPPHYDRSTHTGEVELNTRFGRIYGYSAFNSEDDPELESETIACQLALRRASRELYRLKANDLHAKYLGAKAVVDSATGGVPKEMEDVVDNYHRQWKEARKYYEFLGSTEHDWIQTMVEQKEAWVKGRDAGADDNAKRLAGKIASYIMRED